MNKFARMKGNLFILSALLFKRIQRLRAEKYSNLRNDGKQHVVIHYGSSARRQYVWIMNYKSVFYECHWTAVTHRDELTQTGAERAEIRNLIPLICNMKAEITGASIDIVMSLNYG